MSEVLVDALFGCSAVISPRGRSARSRSPSYCRRCRHDRKSAPADGTNWALSGT